MARPFQSEMDALLNDIHAYGDKYEEIIGKHMSDVDDSTHR